MLLRGCSTPNGHWGKHDDGKVFETCFKSQVSSQVTQLSPCHKSEEFSSPVNPVQTGSPADRSR